MHTSSSSIINPNPNNFPQQQQPEQQLKCPRCDSLNTKFCYYNNYNLSQPRHFCKNCRRYWTKGGTLRNIPIGGGTRKISKRHQNPNNNRRSCSSGSTASIPVPQQLQLIGEGQKVDETFGVGGGYSMGPFGNLLMEGLSMSKSDGNDPIGDDFRSNYLKLNDNNGNENGGGDDGWPDLSIFTPGSSFR